MSVEMTEIKDASSFFIRILSDNQYSKIDEELEDFDPEDSGDLEKPIKKGTLCAAKFSADDKWYRARVLRTLGKDQIEV
jgi:staphylococcal nuclease domain-containing protein 1